MRIWLIRHGLTALGEEKRYQGVTDTPLCEAGRLALRPDDRFARVYHSPLLRARETAEVLFPRAEKISVPELREMDFGAFEGRAWWEMENDAAYRAWVDGGCTGRCPGGEDRAAFSSRVLKAVEALLKSGEDELVIVAHGGTQMAVLERWGRPAREYWQWQTKCGCGFLLEYDGERGEMRVLKEVSYLK